MERAESRSTIILYVVSLSAFFASLGQNIYSPIIPLIRDSFHVSVSLVNLSVSLFIFLTAVMQIALGPLIDMKGARKVLITGIIVTILACAGCAITHDFTVFLVLRTLQAVGMAPIPLVAAATIGGLFHGSKRGSAMGTYQMMLSVAPAAAPLLGGFIGSLYGYSGIFRFLAGISIILLLINERFFPKEQQGAGKPGESASAGCFTYYKEILRNRTGNMIMILSFLLFFAYFSVMVYLPVLLTDHYQLDLQIVGLLYLPMAISTIVGSMIFKFLQAKVALPCLSAAGNLFAAGSILLFAWTQSFSLLGMMVALIVYGVCVGILTPLYSTLLASEYDHNRAGAMGMYNFIRYLGMATGPVLSGLLLKFIEPGIEFGLMGVLFAVIILVLLPKFQAKGKEVKTGVIRSKM